MAQTQEDLEYERLLKEYKEHGMPGNPPPTAPEGYNTRVPQAKPVVGVPIQNPDGTINTDNLPGRPIDPAPAESAPNLANPTPATLEPSTTEGKNPNPALFPKGFDTNPEVAGSRPFQSNPSFDRPMYVAGGRLHAPNVRSEDDVPTVGPELPPLTPEQLADPNAVAAHTAGTNQRNQQIAARDAALAARMKQIEHREKTRCRTSSSPRWHAI